MIHLTAPFAEEQVRALRVGEPVEISGVLFTGRDAVHRHLAQGGALPPGVNLQNALLYHCGPVVLRDPAGHWKVLAAGPTTSAREEPYQAAILERFGVRGILGKGGMGPGTLAACQRFGAVYFHAVGGAAQVLAERITRVRSVSFLEQFGSPEAVWEFEIDRLPAVVTMDASGHSLHQEILAASQTQFQRLAARPFTVPT